MPSEGPAVPPRVPGRGQLALLRLVGTLYRWGETGRAHLATFVWGVANGSVIPGPSDTVLVPLGLADPKRAFELAWWSVVGSLIGGLIAYAIGAISLDVATRLLGLMGFSYTQFEALRELFARRGWMVVVLGALPMGSPKLVSIAAGAFRLSIWQFLAALAVVRVVRFMVVAIMLRYAGTRLVQWAARKLGRPLPGARDVAPGDASSTG
ncbi:MAG TPA: VTT domain-containing protein [Gemmatimonadaceae bacterium]|nr:VTT domain-containing protein [Gemmatimonadaceae bacterium]